jgi:hypothetical protein
MAGNVTGMCEVKNENKILVGKPKQKETLLYQSYA